MALPQVETGVIEMIKEEEAQERRDAALAANKPEVAATATEAKAEATAPEAVAAKSTEQALAPASDSSASVAIATASHVAAGADPSSFLADLGITDLKIDFTSFPTITLNDGSFSTDEFKNFGTEFEMVFISKRETFLFRGEKTRDEEPELVYSDDGVTNNKDGKPIAESIESWESRGWTWAKATYVMVLATMVGGNYDQELVQLQVSPASRGKLDGYLLNLGLKHKNPREVVTKVSVGAEVGSGRRAFNPWTFKLVG